MLRHPAGLNDTLADLASVVAIADEAPTRQARQVCDETMARIEAELGRLEELVAVDLAGFNALLREAGIDVVGTATG